MSDKFEPGGIWEFDSLAAFVDQSKRPASTSAVRASRGNRHGTEWSGTETFEQATDLAETGWQDGAERLANLTARLSGRLANVSAVQRIGYDVVGPGTLDVGRYIMGHPEMVQVWRPSEELTDVNPSRIIRILAMADMNCEVQSEPIFWRGAAACAIADLAESSGVRCEIYMGEAERKVQSATGTYRTQLRRVCLKRAQDSISPAVLAFALCHPASLRRIGFGVMETYPAAIRAAMGYQPGGGYGSAAEFPESERGECIYIPMDTTPFRNAQTTATWVIDMLREHEIEVETV